MCRSPGGTTAAGWGPYFERSVCAQTFARCTLITTLIALKSPLFGKPGNTVLGKNKSPFEFFSPNSAHPQCRLRAMVQCAW